MRDADRAGEAPPLLVLHDEHEVPGAARADLVGQRVVLAGVVEVESGLLLVDADVPRDERRDLSKRKRAVAGPAVAREDVEEDGAAEEEVIGIIKASSSSPNASRKCPGALTGRSAPLLTPALSATATKRQANEMGMPARLLNTSSRNEFDAA